MQTPTSKTVCDNLNIYWLAATGLAVWFLFIHSPPIILQRNFFKDPLFFLHLIGAYGIYLSCIHNTLLTPSVSFARLPHIWVGRVGMVLGVISFIVGAYLAMGRYIYIDPGFSISITIGGVFQIAAQYLGWTAIRRYQVLKKKIQDLEDSETEDRPVDSVSIQSLKNERDYNLNKHIGCMIGLFIGACGIPAVLRLTDKTFNMLTLVCVMNLVALLYGRAMMKLRPVTNDAGETPGSLTPLVG